MKPNGFNKVVSQAFLVAFQIGRGSESWMNMLCTIASFRVRLEKGTEQAMASEVLWKVAQQEPLEDLY